jgi:hypothetical protein
MILHNDGLHPQRHALHAFKDLTQLFCHSHSVDHCVFKDRAGNGTKVIWELVDTKNITLQQHIIWITG